MKLEEPETGLVPMMDKLEMKIRRSWIPGLLSKPHMTERSGHNYP